MAMLDIASLNQRFKANQIAGGQNSSVTVADRNGIIIIRDPYPDHFIGTAIPESYMRLVDAKTAGVIDVMSQDGTRRILGYEPVSVPPVGLYISVGLSQESSFAMIEREIDDGIIVAVIGSGLAFFLSWLVGRNLFIRPLDDICRAVEAWMHHGDNVRIKRRTGATEIVALAQRLNTMMDQLNQQKYMNAILIQELNHRIKNTIATTQALARMSFRHVKTDPAIAEFDRRLAALATAHETLLRNQWTHADLRQTVERTIFNLFGAVPVAFAIAGPDINIGRRHVLAVTMIIHELTTNAMKYGALSDHAGVVQVSWTAASVGDVTQIFFKWLEKKGPPVQTPQKTGFGTTLIQRAFTHDFDAIKYEYAAEGVICQLSWTICRDELTDARDDRSLIHRVTAPS
jgi:two-component sensor histidine kinase